MEATWKITIATLTEMRAQFADWAIAKLSAFATQPSSAPVPEPPPPTPTRTYSISQPLLVTPTSSLEPTSPSLLQPFAILLLTLIVTVTVLTALHVYKYTSTHLSPPSPLYPRHFDDLTSDDITDVKDWSNDDLCRLVGFLFAKLSDASNANARPVPATMAESQPPVDDSMTNDDPLSTTEVEMTEPPASQDPTTPPPPEHTQSRSRRTSTFTTARATHSTPPLPPPPPTTSNPEFDLLPEPNHAPLLLSKLLYIACAFQRLESIFGLPSFDSETATLVAKCDYRTFSQLVGPRLAFVEDRILLQLMHLKGRNQLATDLADAHIKHDVLRDEYDNVVREYADLVASCAAQTESRDPGSLRSCYPFVFLGLVLVCYVQFYLDV
ncbi:hypothetical protein FRB93_010036 [Tulasnella sp. JGI-2019a]|nr:hypothetical protein FRB93_010036 [Tulasnella sp. JGI-2019a]